MISSGKQKSILRQLYTKGALEHGQVTRAYTNPAHAINVLKFFVANGLVSITNDFIGCQVHPNYTTAARQIVIDSKLEAEWNARAPKEVLI